MVKRLSIFAFGYFEYQQVVKRLKKCKLESALCVEVFLEICCILSQINCQLSKKENKIKKNYQV